MKSLLASQNNFSKTAQQIATLEQSGQINFSQKLREIGLLPFKPKSIDVFQINMGKMCNQVCKHCHVDAGPDRKEIMSKAMMLLCIEAIKKTSVTTIDLTGGAPEMNPDFRWFVEELSFLGKKIIVRCNLTIIVANPKYNDLPAFFKKHNIEVVSSLPYFTAFKTDSQRGDGVFEKSLKALRMLNEVGYGMEGSGLTLNLVYNPSGAFLPADQNGLELEFKKKLKDTFDITFNSLFAITNLPVSRFLDYLVSSKNYLGYIEKLVNAFNPAAATGVMCRNTISISWDGYIYDCDFNQMLELNVATKASQHLSDFNNEVLLNRNIVINQHCYGCTAGAGSSCGGETT